MEGSWSKTADTDDETDVEKSNSRSWSHTHNQNDEETQEGLVESLNRHLNTDGHDPRIRNNRKAASVSNGGIENSGSEQRAVSRWWKHILGSLIIAPLMFILVIGTAILHIQIRSQITLLLMTVMAILFLATRFALPIATYRDITTISDSNVEWSPRKWLYVIGTTIVPPPMEFFTTVLYLTRRRRFVGRPNIWMAFDWVKTKTGSIMDQIGETENA